MSDRAHAVAGYSITQDRTSLDVATIHDYLSNRSYWAQGRTLEAVRLSIENSLCYGVLSPEGRQVGFARVVTDMATFAWICDVFVLESEQGKGLGKWLVRTVVGDLESKGVRRLMLATKDAHELYRRHGGFEVLKQPERLMEKTAHTAFPSH